MSILFTLFILSIYTIKPEKPDVLVQFQVQLKTVENHQKKYRSIKHELERNYSWQKYKEELKSLNELYDIETVQVKSEYFDLYAKVKRELEDRGLVFD